MQFEWDDKKAEVNFLKHNISFVAATGVFDDPRRIEEDSTKPEFGEVRVKTIGMVNGELIVAVIHTDRADKRRIISARKARKNEQEKYYTG